jgi:hypothetical protein
MSEVWRISTAKTARRCGIFKTSIWKEENTTNPHAIFPMWMPKEQVARALELHELHLSDCQRPEKC